MVRQGYREGACGARPIAIAPNAEYCQHLCEICCETCQPHGNDIAVSTQKQACAEEQRHRSTVHRGRKRGRPWAVKAAIRICDGIQEHAPECEQCRNRNCWFPSRPGKDRDEHRRYGSQPHEDRRAEHRRLPGGGKDCCAATAPVLRVQP